MRGSIVSRDGKALVGLSVSARLLSSVLLVLPSFVQTLASPSQGLPNTQIKGTVFAVLQWPADTPVCTRVRRHNCEHKIACTKENTKLALDYFRRTTLHAVFITNITTSAGRKSRF